MALAAGVSAAASLLAWWAGTLTASGACAAWVTGLMILSGTGWQGGAVLAAFFLSSNLVSRFAGPSSGCDAKGDRRDAAQVWANGGIAAIGATFSPAGSSLGIWVVTCALAAAAADTWATSVGGLSRVAPRLAWSGRRVPAGTNGGMTLLGSVGAAGGALIVSATGAIAAGSALLLPVATLIGFLGMVADSTLGALLQGHFHCRTCNETSEWPVHRCGATTTRMGGLAWLNNDGVNFLATAIAGCTAVVVWRLLPSLAWLH